ncbi:MAG: hypothetical protein ACLR56_13385 [Oscillospiraceae bacterium]
MVAGNINILICYVAPAVTRCGKLLPTRGIASKSLTLKLWLRFLRPLRAETCSSAAYNNYIVLHNQCRSSKFE